MNVYQINIFKQRWKFTKIIICLENDAIPTLEEFDELVNEKDSNEESEEGSEEDEKDRKMKKVCFILEDISLCNLPRVQKKLIDRYFGCWSTHHSITIIATFQDMFQCPENLRRMCSLVVLWKTHDLNSSMLIAKRLGLRVDDLKYIFDNICNNKYDSLTIDTHRVGEARLRKKLFQTIQLPKI